MESKRVWDQHENGLHIGEKGSEGGEIIRDEDHILGARITLEENPTYIPNASHAITFGIYGLMVHTCYFSSLQEANRNYDLIKREVELILNLPEGLELNKISEYVERLVDRF